MRIFYIVCLLWAVLIFLAYLYYNTKAMDSLMGIMFFSIVVSNWGNLMIATSKSLDEVLLGKKVCYFCTSVIAPSLLLLIISICNFKVHKKIKFLIYIVACMSYGLISTIGRGDLYYSNERIVKKNGIMMLEKDSEILHTFYFAFILFFLVMAIGVVIYTCVKKVNVSKKNIILLTAMGFSNTVIFFIGRLISSGLEIMPLIYVVDATILLYIMQRISLYNVENSVMNSLLDEKSYAYLVLDKDKRYITSNDVAKELFPELVKLRVDEKMDLKEKLFGFIDVWLNDLDRDIEGKEIVKNYKKDDVFYECRIKYLHYIDRQIGYIIELVDDTDKQNYLELVQSFNTDLVQEVKRQTQHIFDMQDKLLYAVGNMVENRDMNTGGHINRTSYVVGVLLEEIKNMGEIELDDEYIKNIIKAAPLHDLGKISIEDSILRKPGAFTDEEYEIMKSHSAIGAEIVEKILKDIENEGLVKVAVNIARYHHEKWNGCGYPDKLKGTDIPFEARVMAVADVYDALVSNRCYKKKMSFEQANAIILESMGSHFDPSLEKYYIKVRDKLEAFYIMGEGDEA